MNKQEQLAEQIAKAEELLYKHVAGDTGLFNNEVYCNFDKAAAAIVEAMGVQQESEHNPNLHNLDITHTGVCSKCGGTNLMDAPSPAPAKAVEAMDAPAKEGMKWVKASERLPDYGKHVHLKVSFISTPLWGWLEKSTTGDWFKTMYNGSISINEVVWLDESAPAKEAISVPAQPKELVINNNPLCCLDCDRLYDNFCLDVVLSKEQWKIIHPDEQGVLCAQCIINRAGKIGAIAAIMTIDFGSAQPLQPSLEEKKEDLVASDINTDVSSVASHSCTFSNNTGQVTTDTLMCELCPKCGMPGSPIFGPMCASDECYFKNNSIQQ
jgi:hypothetical protein